MKGYYTSSGWRMTRNSRSSGFKKTYAAEVEKQKYNPITKEVTAMLDPKNLAPGEEQYEPFKAASNRKTYTAYDYRHTDGELFSCVKPNLGICRAARDTWITAKMLRVEKEAAE